MALDYKVKVNDVFEKIYLPFSESYNQTKTNLILNSQIAKQIFGTFEILEGTQFFANNPHLAIKKNHHQNQFYLDESDTDWKSIRPAVIGDNCGLKMFARNKSLIEHIDSFIHHFFAQTNFGMRQSKGFGSFATLDFTYQTHLSGNTCVYYKKKDGGFEKQLQTISDDWKKLKAGINFGNDYYKSDLMQYFCMLNGTRWEKRKIKREIKQLLSSTWGQLHYDKENSTYNRIAGCEGDPIDPTKVSGNGNYKYIRAALGLAEHFEFGKSGSPAKVKVSNDTIKRFKAPITFKVVNDYIYMICQSIPDELAANGDFRFKLDSTNLADLPAPQNFDPCHFLDSPWLGENFEESGNWGDYTESGSTNHKTVAEHHEYKKVNIYA